MNLFHLISGVNIGKYLRVDKYGGTKKMIVNGKRDHFFRV
jgi:hypothetical protein